MGGLSVSHTPAAAAAPPASSGAEPRTPPPSARRGAASAPSSAKRSPFPWEDKPPPGGERPGTPQLPPRAASPAAARGLPPAVEELVRRYNDVHTAHATFMLRPERELTTADYAAHRKALEGFAAAARRAVATGADAEVAELREFAAVMLDRLSRRTAARKARLTPWL